MKLYTSRGIEKDTVKSFMRGTVILSDVLVYIPAALLFVLWKFKSKTSVILNAVFIL
jgi:hypothetical protein